jgi:hypothetical protein
MARTTHVWSSVLHGTAQLCLALFVSLWKLHIHLAVSIKLVAKLSFSHAVTNIVLTFYCSKDQRPALCDSSSIDEIDFIGMLNAINVAK